jgi:ectoine hydroxylase
MQLGASQRARYEQDGYLILPTLLSAAEMQVLRAEVDRLGALESDFIKREPNGIPRSILRSHEPDGDTSSAAFRALSRLPRLLGPARQLVGAEDVYIYHTKINVKAALYGGIYAWHQDYGTWERDGVDSDNIVTAMVMLDDVSEEIGGPLYFVPGSHRSGGVRHVESMVIGPRSVERELLLASLKKRPPVPVLGKAGTVALFHSSLIHGSGHNLSPHDRRQAYIVYNPVANRPKPVASPRPDFVCSRNTAPIAGMPDDAILRAAGA